MRRDGSSARTISPSSKSEVNPAATPWAHVAFSRRRSHTSRSGVASRRLSREQPPAVAQAAAGASHASAAGRRVSIRVCAASEGVSDEAAEPGGQRSMERPMRYDSEVQPEMFEYEAQPGEWEAGFGEWESDHGDH